MQTRLYLLAFLVAPTFAAACSNGNGLSGGSSNSDAQKGEVNEPPDDPEPKKAKSTKVGNDDSDDASSDDSADETEDPPKTRRFLVLVNQTAPFGEGVANSCSQDLAGWTQYSTLTKSLKERFTSLVSSHPGSIVATQSMFQDGLLGPAGILCDAKDSRQIREDSSVVVCADPNAGTGNAVSVAYSLNTIEVCGVTISQAPSWLPLKAVDGLASQRDDSDEVTDLYIVSAYQGSRFKADQFVQIVKQNFKREPRIHIVFPKSAACRGKIYPAPSDSVYATPVAKYEFVEQSVYADVAKAMDGKLYDLCESDFKSLFDDLK